MPVTASRFGHLSGRLHGEGIKAGLAAVLLLLAGCSYDPGMRGDHDDRQYGRDLAACRQAAMGPVRKQNAATPQSWIVSPITGPAMMRAAIGKCLATKGYASPEK